MSAMSVLVHSDTWTHTKLMGAYLGTAWESWEPHDFLDGWITHTKKNPTGGNGIFDESFRRAVTPRNVVSGKSLERLLSKRSNHALPKRVRRNRVTRLRLESSIPSRIIVFSSSSRRRRLREQRFEQLHAEECVREAGRHHHRRVLGLGALDHQGVGR